MAASISTFDFRCVHKFSQRPDFTDRFAQFSPLIFFLFFGWLNNGAWSENGDGRRMLFFVDFYKVAWLLRLNVLMVYKLLRNYIERFSFITKLNSSS